MPSNEKRLEVLENLKMLKMGESVGRSLPLSYIEEYERAVQKKFKHYHTSDCMDRDTIATISYYCEKNGIDIVMGELPEITHKSMIAYSMLRMQLENLLKVSAKECVYNPEIVPNTPWNVAAKIFPDIITQPSDVYMAHIVKKVVERGFKRVLVVQGGVQASTTHDYLMYRSYEDGIHGCLRPPEWKTNKFHEKYVEDMVERFAILDVMQHGVGLFTNFENLSFKSTYGIMRKYSPETQSLKDRDELRFIHARMMKYHYDKMVREMVRSKEELKKLYLSRA